MIQYRDEQHHDAEYAVSTDAAAGVSTGISARDRAHTIRLLADPCSSAADLTRPGHVTPLRARPGGVVEREHLTEASVDLMVIAGLRPAAAVCRILGPNGDLAGLDDLIAFGEEHGLPVISIAQIVEHRLSREILVDAGPTVRLPTRFGVFDATCYDDPINGGEYLVLLYGEVGGQSETLTSIRAECLVGDVFGCNSCDCGATLASTISDIVRAGRGILVYRRSPRGRLNHLDDHMRNHEPSRLPAGPGAQGYEFMQEQYWQVGHILKDLGVSRIRLIGRDIAAIRQLRLCGIAADSYEVDDCETADASARRSSCA